MRESQGVGEVAPSLGDSTYHMTGSQDVGELAPSLHSLHFPFLPSSMWHSLILHLHVITNNVLLTFKVCVLKVRNYIITLFLLCLPPQTWESKMYFVTVWKLIENHKLLLYNPLQETLFLLKSNWSNQYSFPVSMIFLKQASKLLLYKMNHM